MLDELEPLGGDHRFEPPDPFQPGPNRIAALTVGVAPERGIHPGLGQGPARRAQGVRDPGCLQGGRSIGGDRKAGALVDLEEEIDLFVGR